MDIIEFQVADGLFPLYRVVTPGESQMLRALLGEDFRFPLEDGEPLDDLLFDVLAAGGMRSGILFSPPPEARLLGTFELRDGFLAGAPAGTIQRREHTVH
ncbi:MAG: hypothetical protein IH608_02910 [Proteobacteria bacterium]|nr:hypothetical protein [Pseudomonadota bacterium]